MGVLDLLVFAVLAAACLALLLVSRYATELERKVAILETALRVEREGAEKKLVLLGKQYDNMRELMAGDSKYWRKLYEELKRSAAAHLRAASAADLVGSYEDLREKVDGGATWRARPALPWRPVDKDLWEKVGGGATH